MESAAPTCGQLYFTVMCGSVYVEMLNRRQNQLQLVVFDVDCFVVNENSAESMVQDANNGVSILGSVWIVRDETSTYWVNVGICMLRLIHSQNTDDQKVLMSVHISAKWIFRDSRYSSHAHFSKKIWGVILGLSLGTCISDFNSIALIFLAINI